jgi:hypothetical protein
MTAVAHLLIREFSPRGHQQRKTGADVLVTNVAFS